ncbi:MAG: ubiquinone/menaquinone biosynthesis methyltransferase [Dehalococcoidia bacterium]|nr:ubiquinone/menaquinone biosynthesis methyltransferase [Dehalococcoidia bacterium]
MFVMVPPRYDFLNRLLTWTLDERWRRLAARECLKQNPRRMLDLCCGTGDLALRAASLGSDGTEFTGLDFSEPMLEVARRKRNARRLDGKVDFIHGDAGELPFPDGYFDVVGISFAFRNITYKNPLRERYLSEMARVTAPGGRCVIVETSQPRSRLLRAMAHLYFRTVVPQAGRLLGSNRGAYRYLSESARRYYDAGEVAQMLREAGFRDVSYRHLFGGVAALHTGVRQT